MGRGGGWGIGAKLGWAFAAIVALMLCISALSLVRLHHLGDTTAQIIDQEWKKADAANLGGKTVMLNARRTMQEMVSTPQQRQALRQQIADTREQFIAAGRYLQENVHSAQGQDLLAQIGAARLRYAASQKKFQEMVDSGMLEEAAQELQQHTLAALDTAQQHADALAALGRQNAIAMGQAAVAEARNAQWTVALMGLAAALLAALFSWRITRSIVQPIGEAVRVAEIVASGDLEQQIMVKTRDETGQLLYALQAMTQSLRGIVAQVRSGSDAIAAATTQVALGNMDLSSRTEEQASALEQTTAAMQELATTVQHNFESSKQAALLAQTGAQMAARGGNEVEQAVHSMQAVHASSRKISDIIGIIDGIAFQTNILSLNAAVEAARAGEQGRGFAVVASEVRALAARSANAAKEIRGLIDASVSGVATGCELVERAGSTMNEMVHSARQIATLIGEISAASQEQTSGLDQIKDAMLQMDTMTQQNAALVEEAAAAAQSLQAQSTSLAGAVSVFRCGDAAAPLPLAQAAAPRLLAA